MRYLYAEKILSAYNSGKTIQMFKFYSYQWVDLDVGVLGKYSLIELNDCNWFRIKPV